MKIRSILKMKLRTLKPTPFLFLLAIGLVSLSSCGKESGHNEPLAADDDSRATDDVGNGNTDNDGHNNGDDNQNSGDTADGNTQDTEPCNFRNCEEWTACSEAGKDKDHPLTIDDFVTYVNELPKPVTVECIVASFKRPINIDATSNKFSAQGATGRKSPRIFISFEDKLWLSFVADGTGSTNIEVSEITDQEDTIKADFKFPVAENLSLSDPYKSIMFNESIPSCGGLCHSGYRIIKEYDDGTIKYASEFIKPNLAYDVPLVDIRSWFVDCATPSTTSSDKLCDFYNALFKFGDVGSFDF